MRGAVICLLALAAVSAHPEPSSRIVGGQLTTIDQYPEMAAVLASHPFGGFAQSCGGVIINNRSILTAAHCTFRLTPSMMRSRLGSSFASSGGVEYHTSQIIDHPRFNRFTMDCDISILRVQGSIVFTPVIKNAQIASRNYQVADNQVVWAAGWGFIAPGGPPSEQLRHVQIWTVNQNFCRQRHGNQPITDNMLCSGYMGVGGRDQCNQDSGGPLYHNRVVVGVHSFGPPDCGSPVIPRVNVRVQRFANWIDQNAMANNHMYQ